jgi:polysaccharide biosynthesis protein PelF
MISLFSSPIQRDSVRPGPQYEDVDLAIVAESTYPYLRGGVSAVIHDIVVANPDRSVGIIHIAWDSDCPTEHVYDVPPNVRWIYPVFLSMNDHLDDFKLASASTLDIGPSERRELSEEVFAALDELVHGNTRPLWHLYDRTLNPRTRVHPFWLLLGTQEFMTCAMEKFSDYGIPFTKLFWLLREFFSLTCAIAGEDYPKAKVYHSHTTGYAGLLAAIAARQNCGRVLLTEHNLYTRDTINLLLDRNMNTVVSARDWQVDFEADPTQRAWMAWYTEIGRLIYKAADHITYLYPAAVTEARGLGSEPEKSEIVPNGMLLDKFESARIRYVQRRAAIRQPSGQPAWRLVYCARLVPIKGLLDLIGAVNEVVQAGECNFTLDVLGHSDEVPEYAAQCHRRAHELGLDSYIHFRGNLNMAEVLGDFDALVLASYNEGQPLAVMEAMAVGLPVIGTCVGGMEQLILSPLDNGEQPAPGPCGILVRPGKVRELADAIRRLTTDQALYSSFSENSRERICRYFALDKAMSAYRLIYRELEMPAVPPIPAPRPMYRPSALRPVGRHRQEDLQWQAWMAKSLGRVGASVPASPRR